MPIRNIPLITNDIYHVVNRGVAQQGTFDDRHDYQHFIELMTYYQIQEIPMRYSYFVRLPFKEKQEFMATILNKENKRVYVEIIAYCLMPNHIHLLLKQSTTNGISNFMRYLSNSYTRYYNEKRRRIGPLFQGRFKAVRIETTEQLLHVSRYIHLNPYSAFIVKSLDELKKYSYSSLGEYLKTSDASICAKENVLTHFDQSSYFDFIHDNAEYQRELQTIKNLLLE